MVKRKTTEEFIEEVYNLVKNEYEVLGEYINSKVNIEMKHNTCGYIYEVRPNSFLKGNRCPKCFGSKKKTLEMFKREVYDKVKDDYDVLGEYVSNKTKIEIKHNRCGYIYQVRPYDFLRGNRCPVCVGKKKRTTEDFKKEVYDKVKDEYEVLGEYINTDTPIQMKHNKCNHTYPVRPNDFLRGVRCPKCARKLVGEKIKKTLEEFREEVYNLTKDEYEVLGEYLDNKTHIEMKHAKCNYIYTVRPNDFLRGKRCPKCANQVISEKLRKAPEEFKKEVYERVKDEYEVLGIYINANTHIEMKHTSCNHIYMVRPSDFLRGKRCPRCNSSKGELAIRGLLDKYKIAYKHNKTYGECSYKGLLRFDFLIYDENGNLKLICEYDGIQHFEPVDIFGGEKGFKETQKRDKIKNKFCKDNEIPLLRIPYWEFDNIHRILGKKLYKLVLIK